jgi:hypothetical protein
MRDHSHLSSWENTLKNMILAKCHTLITSRREYSRMKKECEWLSGSELKERIEEMEKLSQVIQDMQIEVEKILTQYSNYGKPQI